MKLQVNYNKLPNGKISAFIIVTDKGEFLTDKIFKRADLDLSGIAPSSKLAKFPLSEHEINYVNIFAEAETIEKHVESFIKMIRLSIAEWSNIRLPENKEYNL